jgi:hypothetical protein
MTHGKFSGNPKTEWLVDHNGKDRNMKLLEDFFYTDPQGKVWNAPAESEINGASIPRALWSTVGSPYTDDYRRASIVHDVACDAATSAQDRKKADVMFYHACLAGGCDSLQAAVLYAGVRIGAWAAQNLPQRAVTGDSTQLLKMVTKMPIDDHFIQEKLKNITNDIKELSDSASLSEIDALIENHIRIQ